MLLYFQEDFYRMDNDQKFWNKVSVAGPSDCWLWKGVIDAFGYGCIKRNGIQTRTHRHAWQLTNGAIPPGMQINHTCDIPDCVNPNHLKIGTQQENIRDKIARNRQAKGLANGTHTHPEKRPMGEKIGNSKLKESEVKLIKKSLLSGATLSWLAEQFNVTKQSISGIKRQKTWRHVNA